MLFMMHFRIFLNTCRKPVFFERTRYGDNARGTVSMKQISQDLGAQNGMSAVQNGVGETVDYSILICDSLFVSKLSRKIIPLTIRNNKEYD